MKGLWLKHLTWASWSIRPSFFLLVHLFELELHLQDVQNKVYRTRTKTQFLRYKQEKKSQWLLQHLNLDLEWLSKWVWTILARFDCDLKVKEHLILFVHNAQEHCALAKSISFKSLGATGGQDYLGGTKRRLRARIRGAAPSTVCGGPYICRGFFISLLLINKRRAGFF